MNLQFLMGQKKVGHGIALGLACDLAPSTNTHAWVFMPHATRLAGLRNNIVLDIVDSKVKWY